MHNHPQIDLLVKLHQREIRDLVAGERLATFIAEPRRSWRALILLHLSTFFLWLGATIQRQYRRLYESDAPSITALPTTTDAAALEKGFRLRA
jgi:hypothetical protein